MHLDPDQHYYVPVVKRILITNNMSPLSLSKFSKGMPAVPYIVKFRFVIVSKKRLFRYHFLPFTPTNSNWQFTIKKNTLYRLVICK